jgi:hypothetical protein
MAVIPAQTIGDLLDDRAVEATESKDIYDARGMRWGKSEPGGRIKMLTEVQRREVIDLSARGNGPKDIAERLGLNAKQVANVRMHWKGAIDARRKELAGQKIDGTPATIARKPVDSAPVQTATTPEPAVVHTHMMPRVPEPDKPRVTIRSVEIKGAFGNYCLMAERIDLLTGAIGEITYAELPALIADLTAIQAMATEGVTWRP